MNIHLGDGIAALAFLLSIYASWQAHKFNELQRKVNFLIVEKEQREALQANCAEIGANFVKFGSREHKLKIFNKGRSNAYNVSLDFPEGNELVSESDIQSKFPMEILEPGQSV